MDHIAEIRLAQIWNAQWLAGSLRLCTGQSVRVVYRGVWTHGLGPDFTGAYVDIDGELAHGDVEVHSRASAWFDHGHQVDPAYNRVVLHVVLDDDLGVPVRRADGGSVPTLALIGQLPGPLERFPSSMQARPLGSIGFAHCAPAVAAADPDRLREVWNQAGDARMRAKYAEVSGQLSIEPPAQVLYTMLADALGYSHNRQPMRLLAERLSLAQLEQRMVSRSLVDRRDLAAALLLGVAGFLPLSPRELEVAALDVECRERIEALWQRDGGAWWNQRLAPTGWRFARVRPAAHPIRRLLALAAIVARLDHGLIEDLCAQLQQARPHRALLDWLAAGDRYLGVAHAHEMVVNAVVPFALAYGEWTGQESLVEAAGALWHGLPAGRGNVVVRQTAEQICGSHRVPIRTARAEQGLIHLHRTGCSLMRCHECPVAHLALTQEVDQVNREPGS